MRPASCTDRPTATPVPTPRRPARCSPQRASRPPGGWPIIALAHGTTGIEEQCAPSESADLWGLSDPVRTYVKMGYAVAMADYQGLGEDGVHPYMDAKTAGLNVIDSVRALRHTFPGTSRRWLAFGGSQGGGASWAADELAKTYAPELELVGAVANGPSADLVGIVAKAQQGLVTDDQMPLFLILVQLVPWHGDARPWRLPVGCGSGLLGPLAVVQPQHRHRPKRGESAVEAHRVRPRNPAAANRLDGDTREIGAAATPPVGAAVGDLRRQGHLHRCPVGRPTPSHASARWAAVQWDLQPDKGHGDVDITRQFVWLGDRFAEAGDHQCPVHRLLRIRAGHVDVDGLKGRRADRRTVGIMDRVDLAFRQGTLG